MCLFVLANDADDDNDEEYFRKEVGANPDPGEYIQGVLCPKRFGLLIVEHKETETREKYLDLDRPQKCSLKYVHAIRVPWSLCYWQLDTLFTQKRGISTYISQSIDSEVTQCHEGHSSSRPLCDSIFTMCPTVRSVIFGMDRDQ